MTIEELQKENESLRQQLEERSVEFLAMCDQFRAKLQQAETDRDEARNEISNLKHDYEVVSIERNAERERMDILEKLVFTNREGEHELHFDFTMSTLRAA